MTLPCARLVRSTSRFSSCGAWLAAAFLLGCGAGAPPNLLLVVVDTLRADHLGSYGYERDTTPNLDAFAATGVRFARAYTAAPWTMPSVASIFTGQHPSRHGLMRRFRALPQTATTLAERLGDAGYRTAAVTSHILLDTRFGFDQGFDVFLLRSGGHQSLTGGNVTLAATSLLRDFVVGDAGPFFLFVHYFDPHYLYRDHTEIGYAGKREGRIQSTTPFPKLFGMRAGLTPEEVEFVRSLYDEEVRYTDEQIGQLLAALAEAGLADDTLVVVTADHGEAFMEHGWLGHTGTLRDPVVRVPLLVRGPGVASDGHVVEEPVSLVSLTPTLLDLLGVPAEPADFDGAPFSHRLRGASGESPAVFAEVDYVQHEVMRASQRMVVDYPHKLIEDRLAGEVSLFDVAEDPGEQHDLASQRPDVVAALRAHFTTTGVAPEAETPEAPPELSDEQSDQLRELGYLE